MSKNKVEYQVGDWVRFYRAGTFVIGVVNYIEQGYWEDELLTDYGMVKSTSVVEHRPVSTDISNNDKGE